MNIEEYNKNLSVICKKKKLFLKKIGSVKNYPIFSVQNLKIKNFKTIIFCAGIHGDEFAPCLAVLEFIRKFNFHSAKKLNLIFIPIANPIGFSAEKRRGYKNVDINRHFSDRRLKRENKIIYDYLKKFKIDFFCSLHEDPDEKKFYLYDYENKNQKIYSEIIKLSKKFFPTKNGCVELNGRCLVGQNIKRGIIPIKKSDKTDGSIETQLIKKKICPSLICTETPAKEDLNKRIKLNEKIIEKIIEITKK